MVHHLTHCFGMCVCSFNLICQQLIFPVGGIGKWQTHCHPRCQLRTRFAPLSVTVILGDDNFRIDARSRNVKFAFENKPIFRRYNLVGIVRTGIDRVHCEEESGLGQGSHEADYELLLLLPALTWTAQLWHSAASSLAHSLLLEQLNLANSQLIMPVCCGVDSWPSIRPCHSVRR